MRGVCSCPSLVGLGDSLTLAACAAPRSVRSAGLRLVVGPRAPVLDSHVWKRTWVPGMGKFV